MGKIKEMFFDEDSRKNRMIVYLIITALILLGIIFYKGYNLDEECWFWNLDENGVGFGTTTGYCFQLENNCEAEFHNLNCQWIDDGKTKGCQCKYYESDIKYQKETNPLDNQGC